MKLAWKIFCMAYFIVLLTVGIGGFLLVQAASASVMDSKVESVLTANEYAGKMFLALCEKEPPGNSFRQSMQSQLSDWANTEKTDTLTICWQEETFGYRAGSFVTGLSHSEQGYAFVNDGGTQKLQAVCRIDLSDKSYYIQTLSDFSEVFARRDRLAALYRYTLLASAIVSGAVLFCFSVFITRPLGRLSRTANLIAAGDYSKRIPVGKRPSGSEEIRRLSEDFNIMAQAVERNVGELKNEIEKREIFVADFTHELKTPMTSIIGYADMLRSYELDDSERREAANAVYREGRRLERLSMQLLDLIVLRNGQVSLQPVLCAPLFESLRQSVRFLAEKYGVTVEIHSEPAVIRAEPVLLISLLYNLIDNACKASEAGQTVTVFGRLAGERYAVSVTDYGKGIDRENLAKITEPFYMEDKSRSRKLGGAGLGLALCKQIAQLHGTQLVFESEKGKGTRVTVEPELVINAKGNKQE